MVDGCHEGNKIRIVDGDQQESGLFFPQVLNLISFKFLIETFSLKNWISNFIVETSVRLLTSLRLRRLKLPFPSSTCSEKIVA